MRSARARPDLSGRWGAIPYPDGARVPASAGVAISPAPIDAVRGRTVLRRKPRFRKTATATRVRALVFCSGLRAEASRQDAQDGVSKYTSGIGRPQGMPRRDGREHGQPESGRRKGARTGKAVPANAPGNTPQGVPAGSGGIAYLPTKSIYQKGMRGRRWDAVPTQKHRASGPRAVSTDADAPAP